MSQLEIVFGYTKKIEALLKKEFSAEGRGLHTKLDSVESRLPVALVKKLRWIATVRNNLAHTEGFAIENITDFMKSCDLAIAELEAIAKPGIKMPKRASGNMALTLEEMENSQESAYTPSVSRKRRKRSLLLGFPFIIGLAASVWYVYIYEPSLFHRLQWFLNDKIQFISHPKAYIGWSSPEAASQHAESAKAGNTKRSNLDRPKATP